MSQKYKLSKKSRERLEGIEKVLIDIIEKAITDSPYDFGIPKDGGLRTDERQKELYALGRTTEELIAKGIKGVEGKPEERKITWTLKSYHKTGKAFDIYAYVGGKAKWDMKYMEPIARHLQKVAKEHFNIDLEWGYDLWKKDGAHFQIK